MVARRMTHHSVAHPVRNMEIERMSQRPTTTSSTLVGVLIPIGAGIGMAFGAIYRDVPGFMVAGAAIGAELTSLILIFAIARTKGDLSGRQFANGLMLIGAMGFAVGAVFVPDRLVLYSVLAVACYAPAAVWLWSNYRSSKRRVA